MSAMATQITSLTIVYSTVYTGADQRKHQSSASLAFVRGIHRGPVNSPHKWPVTRKMFPFDDVIMTHMERFNHCDDGAGVGLATFSQLAQSHRSFAVAPFARKWETELSVNSGHQQRHERTDDGETGALLHDWLVLVTWRLLRPASEKAKHSLLR